MHLIHGDLIINALSQHDHVNIPTKVIVKAGIALNPEKCLFGKYEANFRD